MELMWALTEVNRRVSQCRAVRMMGKGKESRTMIGACALVHTYASAVSDE